MTENAKLLTALCTAMGQVHKVGKTNENSHDKYKFASIDDFLAMVNPICAQNGLFVWMDEVAREDFERQSKYGTSPWVRVSFSITMYHTSGEALPPVTRSVEVLRNGAQAYGSAQSYVLKQFLRGVLLIPTGDQDDTDFRSTDAGTVVKDNATAKGLADAWTDGVLDSLPENATPRQKAEAFAQAICDEFQGKGEKALGNVWEKRKKLIAKFEAEHPDLHEKVVDAFMAREVELADAKRETVPV